MTLFPTTDHCFTYTGSELKPIIKNRLVKEVDNKIKLEHQKQLDLENDEYYLCDLEIKIEDYINLSKRRIREFQVLLHELDRTPDTVFYLNLQELIHFGVGG